MSDKELSPGKRSQKRGGNFFPALCNVIGTLMLLAVLALALLLTLPQLLNKGVFNVVSGSMEPALPMGSLVYTEAVAPEEIREGDIIAFTRDEYVVIHRVLRNQTVMGELITKGDANNTEDIRPVPYDAVIGRVKRHIPMLGQMLSVYTSNLGKVFLLGLAACGLLFNNLAARLREWEREKLRMRLAEERDAKRTGERE